MQEPDPSAERNPIVQVELALQAQNEERARVRRKWITTGGIIAYLVSPLAIGVFSNGIHLGGPWSLVIALVIPTGIGASIAYFGMTTTGHQRDPWEWGLGIPSRCFWYGMAPYVVVSVIAFCLMPFAFLCVMIGWAMTLLGGGLTAHIVDRWFYKDE